VGWSELSDASAPYTPDELPGTPPIAQADWGDGTATVTWGVIPNDGSEILDVTVAVSPADVSAQIISGGQQGGSATFSGLTNGTAYSFTLVARNRKGESPPSGASSPVVPAGAPRMDQVPSFVATNGLVSVDWVPADGNGDDDLSYTVVLTDETSGDVTRHDVGATLSTQLSAVNGHVYNATINVQNKYTRRFAPDGVNGPRSASDKAIGVPGAPATISATAGSGNGAVNLTWAAADMAGGTLSQYQLSVNGGEWQNVGTGTSTVLSSGLTLGTAYTFRVRALNDNKAGEAGAESASSSTATPYTPPAQPIASCSPSVESITCTWSAGAANGPGPYQVSVTGATNSSQPSGSWSSGVIGRSQTRSITVTACNAGTNGNNCSTSLPASASTWPPASVSIAWGASAEGEPTIEPIGGVATASSLWINVNVSNFAPGNYGVQCQEWSGGSWVSWSSISANRDDVANVGGSGTGTAKPCFMGFTGRTVRVVVNGVVSNQITR
jgi:titin